MDAGFLPRSLPTSVACPELGKGVAESAVRNLPEKDLIWLVKGGGELAELAFEVLFDKSKEGVYAFVMAKLATTSMASRAEDVCIEAFARAWKKIRSFRGESNFTAWVRAIAWRLCLDTLRKEGRESTMPDADFLEAILDEASCSDVREVVISTEEKLRLESLMERLSQKERLVILAFLDGHSDSKVAARLGLGIHQVNGIKHRTVQKLREWMHC